MIVLSFCSCQKVIDLKLNDADIKYVVEGIITDQPGVCKVNLTQSKPFYENNQFPGISGATVTIKDNDVEFSLAETRPEYMKPIYLMVLPVMYTSCQCLSTTKYSLLRAKCRCPFYWIHFIFRTGLLASLNLQLLDIMILPVLG